MAIDRNIWKGNLTPTGKINWPCPSCNLPRLKLVPDSLHKIESRASLLEHDEGSWEPDFISGRFICLLKCEDCNESLAIVGDWWIDEGEVWNEEISDVDFDYFDTFKPSFVSVPPPIIELPKTLPDDVKEQLTKSFQMFWTDAESCANRVRASVEKLLDHLKIRRKRIAKSGKRVALSLHERIEDFKSKDNSLGENLMAVKWLGNAGSHSSSIQKDDLLDGYEILEHVLSEIYTQRTKRIATITKQINRKRRPRSAQKRKGKRS